MSKITAIVSWVQAHWGLFTAIAAALLVFVNSLVVAFKDYPVTAGILTKISDLLSFLTSSNSPGTIKSLGVRSKPPGAALKLLLAFVLLGALAPSLARAADVSSGPTIPLVQVRLAGPTGGSAVPTILQAGAGYQFSFGWLPTAILGKQFDLIQVSLAGFAGGGGGTGQASAAVAVCALNQLICLGFGSDLVAWGGAQTTGLLAHETKANAFALLSLGFEFGFGPYAPPTGIEQGAQGLERGNHVYFGL